MTMMNQTSSKNLLLCLLLYLIREDEVKTIHRSACPLVSPKAFLCIKSDIEKICVPQKKCFTEEVFFLCVYLKSHKSEKEGQAKNLSKFQFSSFSFASSFFFFFVSSLSLCFLVKKFPQKKFLRFTRS